MYRGIILVLGMGLAFSAFGAQGLSLKNDPFLYSGEYTDSESGQQYLQARYYNPRLMRFDSWDMEPLSNRYGYGNANPIMNDDPTGHMPGLIAVVLEEIIPQIVAAFLAPETGGGSEVAVDAIEVAEVTGEIAVGEAQTEAEIGEASTTSFRLEENPTEAPSEDQRLQIPKTEEDSDEEPPAKRPRLEAPNASTPVQDTLSVMQRRAIEFTFAEGKAEGVSEFTSEQIEKIYEEAPEWFNRFFRHTGDVANANELFAQFTPGMLSDTQLNLLEEVSNNYAEELDEFRVDERDSEFYDMITDYHKWLFDQLTLPDDTGPNNIE